MAFEFVNNPEKEISANTKRIYKSKLNILAKAGFMNKEDLLEKSEDVIRFLKELDPSKVVLGQFLAAIFYIIGKRDYEKDKRGKIYLDTFKLNYTYSTKDKETLEKEAKEREKAKKERDKQKN